MPWLPEHKLKNRPYEIEKELGQGGFGTTYKARDLTLDIPVVIKTPNSKLQKDNNYQKYVENFTREAKQLAQLGLNPHSHIVRVSTLFKEDDLPCIVMDFIPGQSLYDLVWTQGKLSETKAVEYIKQIGSALSVCHQAGIIHRDVHPNNILIHADNGKAVLIDFGISGTTQTSRNTHSGNRAFAPWEQIAFWEKQNSKTPQIDIYTLAASLYFLVTGEIPTECCGRKYNNSELIEPKQLNPNLSDTINRAILRGMEVKPQNRPNSMQEWLRLLPSIPNTGYPNKKASISQTFKKIEPSYQSRKIRVRFLTFARILAYIPPLLFIIFIIGVAIVDTKLRNNPDEQTEELENLQSQRPTSTQYSTHSIISVAFSPDNQIIASRSLNNTIRLHNSQNKKIATLKGHSDKIFSVAFSPDGKFFANNSDRTIRLWNVKTKQQIYHIDDPNEKYHNGVITSIAFSPDGKTLASGSSDATIILWDVANR